MMEALPPILDKRDEEDLKRHLTSLVPFYTRNWVPDDDDPGITLFTLFSWIYGRVIERYNELPEVQLAEFLKFVDIDRLPAAPATGPAVFTINPDCPEEYISVPKGTLLEAGEDDKGEPIILETVSPLAASPSILSRVVSSNRGGDVVYDNSQNIVEGFETTAAFSASYFKNQQVREIWLGDSALFDLKGSSKTVFPKNTDDESLVVNNRYSNESDLTDYAFEEAEAVPNSSTNEVSNAEAIIAASLSLIALQNPIQFEVKFELPDGVDLNKFKVFGSLYDAENDSIISNLGEAQKKYEIDTLILKFSSFLFDGVEIAETEFNGIKSRWLKLNFTSMTSNVLPYIVNGKCSDLSVNFSGETEAIPDMAQSNGMAVDLDGGSIKPFGSTPRKGNSFYLACDEAFGKVGAGITINMTGGDGKTNDKGIPIVIWEYFGENGWSKLTITSDEQRENRNFIGTSPTIEFSVPDDIAKNKVNDHEHFWIRAILTDGNYGTIVYEPICVDDDNDGIADSFNLTPTSNINEPCYTNVQIDYEISDSPKPEFAFVKENLSVRKLEPEQPLFINLPSTKQAVYLGFDRPLVDAPVSLFIYLKNRIYPESFNPDIDWSYSTGMGDWNSLKVKDDTGGLSRSGYVSFRGPEDFKDANLFGQTLYWLRLENSGNLFETTKGDNLAQNLPAPVFKGIFLNAVESRGTYSVNKEILGSSDGTLLQQFHPTYNPVFDPMVYIEEGKYYDSEESKTGNGTEMKPEILIDSIGEVSEVWVPWRRQHTFVSAGPNDRVYTVDATTGVIRFGDGTRGKVPPIGQNNIAISYRTGGGSKTNIVENTELGLMGAVTFLDGIINPVQIAGGVDMEPLATTLKRGPKSIRYRDRAITATDYEDLLLERFRAIASIKCFSETESTGEYRAGSVTVVIIPASAEMRPPLPVSLQSEVEEYLRQRAAAIPVSDYSVNVIGPEYVECDVEVAITPETGEAVTGLKETVNSTLIEYLHPLTGGKRNKGWSMKRSPTLSEIIAVVEKVPGVLTVKTASFVLRYPETSEEIGRVNSLDERVSISIFEVISSGQHTISIP